jgi:hypothetical protein
VCGRHHLFLREVPRFRGRDHHRLTRCPRLRGTDNLVRGTRRSLPRTGRSRPRKRAASLQRARSHSWNGRSSPGKRWPPPVECSSLPRSITSRLRVTIAPPSEPQRALGRLRSSALRRTKSKGTGRRPFFEGAYAFEARARAIRAGACASRRVSLTTAAHVVSSDLRVRVLAKKALEHIHAERVTDAPVVD